MYEKCLAYSSYFIILGDFMVVYLKEDMERTRYLIGKEISRGLVEGD